ncbi:stearoyl-CoA desaturase (delta-9 desaturase) [Natronospira proteinivora]|uniref:Stearoyl-CoA desaturase (Delta-9 desaturase) n=1 Tax=Natronospira proteinivora TaxID=1807133 RepID=A0ABT1GDX0_9GAMM|nr:fatty acid desaturase [Natronospira proteinivora]MCP1728553.1 stearoyl-CoA desaturase (delta-9 desaturase) [Natronospira proteinivora]
MPLNLLTDGLLGLPGWAYVLYAVLATHFTVMAVTLFLHRDQTHRGVDLHPAVRHVFRFWLWMTTGMTTKAWVAVHRKHHARCETEEDPHSPQVMGLRKVFFQGAELYQQEAAKPETLEKYGRGTVDDWLERNVYTRLPILGVSLLLVLNVSLLGVLGLTIWAIQMMTIPLLAAGVVNGIGHYWGYRNFECRDAATNVTPIGLILGGEELHNNHHAFPSSAKFSLRPWEFDIGWVWLKTLSAVGLARVRRVAPKPLLKEAENEPHYPDLETVRAVVTNRLHVLRAYSRSVTIPAIRESLRDRGHRMIRRARRLLIREPELLDSKDRERLDNLLEEHGTLETIYQYREQLKSIWETTAQNEQVLQRFKNWCWEAEQSGIRHLQEFARSLQRYRMPQAA